MTANEPRAKQSFTLTVDQSPAITSDNTTAFTVGALGKFTVTTTGFPAAAIKEIGALPRASHLSIKAMAPPNYVARQRRERLEVIRSR